MYERSLERSKKGTERHEKNSKMSDLNSTISTIILNVNGVKIIIKVQIMYWI